MSEKKTTVHEPLFHLAKRASISQPKAWLIRIFAIILGFAACGAVAFILIEKLQDNPGKIKDFYKCFIDGIWSEGKTLVKNRKLWKFLKNLAILQCISLAITPAFRMKFWNIGAEGQTLVG
ncbi:MAG: ABC transporter permease, partial [Clostridia bacterium]|nr:ABC transporter permease [Clostridia bacterium]